LEEQNERLKVQNLKCTAQLQVLKSCADRTKHWQNSLLFSHSVAHGREVFDIEGALPSTMMDRTSDDSGLTSDDTWERKTDLMTQSASALYKCASLRHAKKPGKPARIRSNSLGREGGDEENSSTTDSSPWEEKPKPIPTPRKSKASASPAAHPVVITETFHELRTVVLRRKDTSSRKFHNSNILKTFNDRSYAKRRFDIPRKMRFHIGYNIRD
uniref:Shugoshin_C domain-containing protein n=1 Tax=Toxocara canis TaxID=6265 RepID=A0A183TWQ2_TOXCA